MFSNSQFESYRNILYQKTGIFISESKKFLFHTKIQKLMERNQMKTYDDYFTLISNNNNTYEIQEFINAITTNTTNFFRENSHFEFITNNIKSILEKNVRIQKNGEIRVWSAPCSTGQEAITLAMVLRECLGNQIDIKLLATDISSKVLTKAMTGKYTENECQGIPKHFLGKYFNKIKDGYKVNDEILNTIKYRYFNLTDEFSFNNVFDIIFCRNVMIYFDLNSQEKLINKFYKYLTPGGLFFIGHSESLLNKKHEFAYLGPSLYFK